MTTLHIDLESRSAVDLKKTGVYVYAEHPTTDVWCACYAFDDEPVQTWLPHEPMPVRIAEHVRSGGVLFAHNANFEMTMWRYILAPRYGWPLPAIEQWRCTMVQALAMGLPGALDLAGPAAGVEVAKDQAGKKLMLKMAKPRRVNDDGSFVWWDEKENIDRLVEYCKIDVEVERRLEKRLRPLKPSELDLWHLDQRTNLRGVQVDQELAAAAKEVVKAAAADLDHRMAVTTNFEVAKCSEVQKIIAYIGARGVDTESIAKAELKELLADDSGIPDEVRAVLSLRQEAARASVAKINALLRGMSPDGRARGLLQFHAATTGRWGGRRFQPQNLKRPDLKDIDTAIEVISSGDFDLVQIMYEKPLSAVADILRGLLVAAPGHRIVAADYSAIEGRVLPWLAGEHWKVEAYRQIDESIILGEDGKPLRIGGEKQYAMDDMYCQTASKILGRHVTKKDKNDRQVFGKVPELACGYGGSRGAFTAMGKVYGVELPDEQVMEIVRGWREANPAIKQYWYDLEEAALSAITNKGVPYRVGKVTFKVSGSFLTLKLPSGRHLFYPYPEIRRLPMPWLDDDGNPVMKDSLCFFKEVDPLKKHLIVPNQRNTERFALHRSYGGELSNNVTQATARDIMADALPRLEAAGYPLTITVHDEAVTEPLIDHGSVEEMEAIMCDLPAWARGLPIAAEGFEDVRYRK